MRGLLKSSSLQCQVMRWIQVNGHHLLVGMPVSILCVEQHDQMAVLISLTGCKEHFGNRSPQIVTKNPPEDVTSLLSNQQGHPLTLVVVKVEYAVLHQQISQFEARLPMKQKPFRLTENNDIYVTGI